MILQARRLAIGYGRRRIGENLDLSVSAGSALALLGPNGGGKTTLLRTLLGLLPPLDGEITLDGRPLTTMPVRERARLMAFVPQSHAATFDFTVAEVVLMGRTAHADLLARPSQHDREVAAAAIDRLGLGRLADRPYTRISGGERQLALIARALAQEPRLVVLDEPTASLDFGNQGRVLREMRALSRSGLAVLFTTHDPNHALRWADSVVMLSHGRLTGPAPPEEALTQAALCALYGTEIEETASGGRRLFAPG